MYAKMQTVKVTYLIHITPGEPIAIRGASSSLCFYLGFLKTE